MNKIIKKILGEARLKKSKKITFENQKEILIIVKRELNQKIKEVLTLQIKDLMNSEYIQFNEFFLSGIFSYHDKASKAYDQGIKSLGEITDENENKWEQQEQELYHLMNDVDNQFNLLNDIGNNLTNLIEDIKENWETYKFLL